MGKLKKNKSYLATPEKLGEEYAIKRFRERFGVDPKELHTIDVYIYAGPLEDVPCLRDKNTQL